MAVRNDLHFIKTEFDENNYSHVFLIETNSLEKCEAELKQEIKKILVSDEVSLSQIDNNEFVDLITVRPDGKSIKKDQIESLQERIKIKPLVSDKIFFIITPADTMNEIASNKLLKTIEEPNDNVIGYLITNNISQILPTIKSRCESLMAFYDDIEQVEENRSEYIDYVNNIVKFIETGTLLDFNLYLAKDSDVVKYAKEIAITLKDYYNIASGIGESNDYSSNAVNIIIKANTYKRIIHKAEYLNKLLNKNNMNINSELLLEKIFIELKDVVS